jgi:hypothetical protein
MTMAWREICKSSCASDVASRARAVMLVKVEASFSAVARVQDAAESEWLAN